jgi:glutamate transport system substrate-binding protein
MLMRTRRFAVALAAAAIVAALAACGAPGSAGGGGSGGGGSSSSPSAASGDGPYSLEIAKNPKFDAGTTMATLADAGAITIGSKFDQPLFGLLGTGNKPAGFDVAIGALIASKLGIPFDAITWTETPSNIRETAIQNGDVDLVVATYTINDKRKELVDFAGPYFVAGQAIMVLADNNDITGPEDLTGKPVCSVEGSTPAATIVDKYGAQLLATDVYSNCLDPLRNGQVVAVTTDNVILSGFVDQNEPEFKLAGDGKTFTEEPYGVGLMKGDQAFRDFVNDVLQKSFDDGTWARLFEQTAGKVLPTPEPPTIDRY